jgi:hypothetical protein
LKLISRLDVGSKNWDELVNLSPDGSMFSLFGWQDLIISVTQWGLVDFSFGLTDNGILVAVVPLQFNTYTGKMQSSGWGGSGPVILKLLKGKTRERVMSHALELCLSFSRNCGASSFEFSLQPTIQTCIENNWAVNKFVFYGFEDLSEIAQIIDLRKPTDELWKDLSYDARRQIRIAREKGYLVKRLNWRDELDNYYNLHQETYKRTGATPHPKAYFSGIMSITAEAGYSVLWGALSADGRIVAYHNAAWFSPGGCYHTGCSLTEAGENGVGYLLLWEAMLGAKESGLNWYDCGTISPNSSDMKQRNITTFKTKFGGDPHRVIIAKILLDTGKWTKLSTLIKEIIPSFMKIPLRRVLRIYLKSLSTFKLGKQKLK